MRQARRREIHRKCHVDDLLTWNACTLHGCYKFAIQCYWGWFMKIIAINIEINVFLFTYRASIRSKTARHSFAFYALHKILIHTDSINSIGLASVWRTSQSNWSSLMSSLGARETIVTYWIYFLLLDKIYWTEFNIRCICADSPKTLHEQFEGGVIERTLMHLRN